MGEPQESTETPQAGQPCLAHAGVPSPLAESTHLPQEILISLFPRSRRQEGTFLGFSSPSGLGSKPWGHSALIPWLRPHWQLLIVDPDRKVQGERLLKITLHPQTGGVGSAAAGSEPSSHGCPQGHTWQVWENSRKAPALITHQCRAPLTGDNSKLCPTGPGPGSSHLSPLFRQQLFSFLL